MMIYVVMTEGGEMNSLWDEENFKKVYKNFLDTTENYWHKYYDVVKISLNKDEDHQEYSYVNVKDIRELSND